MADRITRKNLEGMAESLTHTLRRAGVIEPAMHVTVSGAYGGYAFHVTGGSLGSGVRTGVAGLRHGHETARATHETGAAVLAGVYAVLNAIRDGVAVPVAVPGSPWEPAAE